MKIKFVFIVIIMLFLFMINGGCEKPEEPISSKLTIKFYDGDELLETKEYTDVNNVVLKEVVKEGYIFDGWYLNDIFIQKFDSQRLKEYFAMKNINLYAKFVIEPNNYTIGIIGEVEGLYLNNPVFTWDNLYDDSGFDISIKKVNDENVTISSKVNNNIYYANFLDFDTEYEFILTGTESKNTSKITFKTIKDNNYDQTKTIVLDNPYMDNMVIQRNEDIIISGVGPEKALISVNFGSELYYGYSDEAGKFKVNVGKKEASKDPVVIKVGEGLNNKVTLNNVLVGDVYLFAGQSNMQWPTNQSDFLQKDVETAIENDVRYFAQNVVTSTTPLDYVNGGKWFSLANGNSNSKDYFSAIAFMTGSILSSYQVEDGVPIGILTAYQGDTNIANWMSSEYYVGTCATKYLHYNAMVYPLKAARIKGVVWYQGCNNSAAGGDYEKLLGDLFSNYRDLFNDEELPFYVIGLACYDGDAGNNYDFSYVRESQAKACAKDNNAYFISSCDDGDPTYIHPRTKRYICERIAKSIEATIYGKDFLAEGPTYESYTVTDNKMIINFTNATGLYAKGDINNIYIAGADGKYYTANAEIVGETLVLSSTKVSTPVYAKYGFGKSPFVNIFNKDNFSMVPFRIDDHNLNIDLLDYESVDNYTFHPDGSKMELELVNDGLKITKTNDGKTYGSVRLDKWGMIAYDALGFNFTVIGTNSGAKIAFRAIEGPSFEIWAYSFVDDFEGMRTFNITTSDFSLVLNKNDSIFDTQAISYIEIMVEATKEATVTVTEARFVNIERTAPRNFTISDVSQSDTETNIVINKSAFAENYEIIVSTDGVNYTNPVYTITTKETLVKISNSLFEVGKAYFVKVIAKNELGETVASNSGYSFYLNSLDKLIINNFDYSNQSSLDAYVSSKMDISPELTCTLDENGVKISSTGGGWLHFIFKLETGSNAGYSKLVFYADFTNYKGTVQMQLANAGYQTYNYTLDISEKTSGIYEINFNDFALSNGTKLNNDNIMWVMFNFANSVNGDVIILDDVYYAK